ncbi:hypothetical protein CFP56_035394 [Quercus suber]|uniref:Secreted protein n=1 Tax=Quercus suber TaxID=58331 RepID=A0AAW0J9S1_QUESU
MNSIAQSPWLQLVATMFCSTNSGDSFVLSSPAKTDLLAPTPSLLEWLLSLVEPLKDIKISDCWWTLVVVLKG